MSTPFRINRVALATVGGPVEYSFPSALTVLAGSVGVGKSTLFELVKHGLGGDALLADVVDTSVTAVTLDIKIGDRELALTRRTSSPESNRVRVYDLQEQVQLEDHFVDRQEPSLSSLLLAAMDLPDDMRAAAKANGSTNQGARITFNDIIKYMYVSQGEINKQIAGSGDSYYQPKRKAVFEVLFDITNPQILELQSQVAKTRADWEEADRSFAVVTQFLADSRTQSRIDAERAQLAAVDQRQRAERTLDSIRAMTGPTIDRETQTLRQLLGEAEMSFAEAQTSLALLQQQKSDYSRERALLSQDIERLARMQSAGARLAEIEFAVCPRCLQSLKNRSVPAHTCRVCLQDDPVQPRSPDEASTYEQEQIAAQAQEIDNQIAALSLEIAAAAQSMESRQALISDLTQSIETRTRERITPQLQAYADATAEAAQSQALQQELEKTLLQWDRADDLERHATALKEQLEALKLELRDQEGVLERRRTEVFDELDSEFAELVATIGVPGVSTATVDRKSYLPVLNGKPFHKFSPVGGVRTATQVAYWISLMNVALRLRDTHFPAFLLMDSPRTSLNDNDDLSAALYRKLVTMADAAEGRVQVIIGDNELPATYRRDYAQLDFDYDHPTVPTVHHPGREAVQTIDTSAK